SRSAPKTRIGFQLFPEEESAYPEAITVGDRHYNVYHLSLNAEKDSDPQLNSVYWLAWREEWDVSGPQQFDLVGASLIIFYGQRYRERTQVLRCEWDMPEKRGKNAGQPHWHIDLLHSSVGGEFAEITLGSPDVSIIPDLPIYSLGEMHLAMGGCFNKGGAPESWHADRGEDYANVPTWAERILKYVKGELEYVKFRQTA
ncbi:MAG: hypothetical protein ACRDHN_10385, partial [Thermomicrobiales bacterium]